MQSYTFSNSWLDLKLLKYQWYRTWRANRSRKRLAKESIFKEVSDVETFTPSPVIQERIKREDAARRARQKANSDYDCKVIQIWEDLIKDTGKHPRDMDDAGRSAFYSKYYEAVASYDASLES